MVVFSVATALAGVVITTGRASAVDGRLPLLWRPEKRNRPMPARPTNGGWTSSTFAQALGLAACGEQFLGLIALGQHCILRVDHDNVEPNSHPAHSIPYQHCQRQREFDTSKW
jgi:hypothetical protein